MASKSAKKSQSTNRATSASKEAASIAASVGDARKKEQRFLIWPEWSDADINAEKWDVAQKGKEKDKGKSPVVQHFFDDPEGKIELPPSMKVVHWKRPQDFITEKTPTIVDPDGMSRFDLMGANENCHESELMRWITSQITALWHSSAVKLAPEGVEAGIPTDGEYAYMWRPWEHIYAINKVSPKAVNIPAYNPHGKYVVRLYWMGAWRKVIIDDTIPFDDEDRMLLPATTLEYELWPMLLSKALIKVASLDYSGGSSSCEFGDFSVISCLTGWLPEAIPLQYGHQNEIWNLLKTSLLEWKLPECDAEKQTGEEAAQDGANLQDGAVKDESSVKESVKTSDKTDGKKDKTKEKEKKDEKKDKKDKDKKADDKKERSMIQDEQPLPEHPEIVVFASYSGPPKYPVRVSVLGEMANASERLRQAGISHMYPHPVRITQTRSCPLEPPPPPEVIPAWKLIRPKKKKTTPTDEPVEPEEEKPIQCLEITSPFINYKVSPVPIPSDTHRPKSSLSRGGARTPSATVKSIEEGDENASEETETNKSVPPEEDKSAHQEVTAKVTDETLKELGDAKGQPVSAASKKKHSLSPVKRLDEKPSDAGDKKTAKERKKSATGKEKVDSKLSLDVKSKGGSVSTVQPESQMTLPSESGGEGEDYSGEEPQGEEKKDKEPAKPESLWMDFDDFTKCFKTLYIYHKPHTYLCNQKHSDLKQKSTTQPTSSSRDRRSAPNTAVNLSSSTPSNLSNTPRGHSNAPSVAHSAPTVDDRSPHYLFVDNMKPTEIVVSFSAVSKWNDIPGPPPREESRLNVKQKDRDSKMADALVAESSVVLDGGPESKEKEHLQPGLLVAEPHSWKSLVTGQPLLRLRTTATRAAVLSLPEGRHVLKFHMQAPLGYHVHMVSTVNFIFGDEEKVMAELVKESCRFIDNGNQIVTSMGKAIMNFHDETTLKQAFDEYESAHCPYRNDKSISKQIHHRVYIEAFYQALKKHLGEAQLLLPEMSFAWRAFNFDCTTKNPLGLQFGISRPVSEPPASPMTTTGIVSDRGSASKRGNAPKGRQPVSAEVINTGFSTAPSSTEPQENKLEHWQNREITADEHVAAIKIQKVWRGYYVRKVKKARTPGNDINLKTQEQLKRAWELIENNMEEYGRFLLRSLFKADPDLMPHYSFFKDEWNKISYADYAGTHPDQPVNTWFVVFREIFYVTEEMLCVPKLYVPIPTCMLRVVNNDTGEEIPRVFQKVAPYVYKRNKRGYTFVAEARTIDQPLVANRWRMRLIGALSPLPAPCKNEVNASFHTRELRDYYVPNEKKIIFRYTVKVQEEHLVTLQMMTSKPDVYIKLQILDHEEEIISAVGKGHVVLPAFVFQKDCTGASEEESRRPASRQSKKGSNVGGASHPSVGKKRNGSANQEERFSRCSTRQSMGSGEGELDVDQEESRHHKYVIQAQALRNSWPLSESNWTFVQMLKEMEKNELKVAFKERPVSAAKMEKTPAASKGKEKTKGKGGKGDKDKGSRPPSQQFDITKPNWTLRVVSDGSNADEIDIKKDTERADEIRAMKKAWEDAEPGRAAKALQSRLNYLKTHMIKVQPDEEETTEHAEPGGDAALPDGTASPIPTTEEGTAEPENEVLLLEPPPPPPPKEILQPLDITPFVSQTRDTPRLKDAEEIERQMQEKQAEIAAYRAYRERVEAWREQDRIARNQAKIRQLEMCEQMQAAVDAARESINKPREAFRQKFLEAERRRQEEIAAQEAALLASQEKAPSPKGRKSAKGKKSAGKKKK